MRLRDLFAAIEWLASTVLLFAVFCREVQGDISLITGLNRPDGISINSLGYLFVADWVD